MKTLLLLTISFFTFALHAQLLTTSGNQWNIKHTSFNGWQDTYGVKIGEEEEINGVTYKKVLENTGFPEENWIETNAFLREDGDKVYCKAGDQPEYVLYDFGLEVGDIFSTIFCDMEVIAKGNITLVDGSSRKTLKLKASGVDIVETTWIEGLGSAEYGIISYPNICATDYAEELLCFYEADEINFPSISANCLILKIKEVEERAVKVYPNPASASLTIGNESGVFSSYKLMDVTARIVHQADLVNGANVIITASYAPGLYNLVLTNNKGESVSKRIILQ